MGKIIYFGIRHLSPVCAYYLRELLQNEEYAELLEVIPLPEATDGKEKMKGLTYSDLAIILNHYKNLMNRFFRKKF